MPKGLHLKLVNVRRKPLLHHILTLLQISISIIIYFTIKNCLNLVKWVCFALLLFEEVNECRFCIMSITVAYVSITVACNEQYSLNLLSFTCEVPHIERNGHFKIHTINTDQNSKCNTYIIRRGNVADKMRRDDTDTKR